MHNQLNYFLCLCLASSKVIEMIVEQHNTVEIVKKRCEERKTTSMEYPLKLNDQFQLIKLPVSSRKEANASNYTQSETAKNNQMEGTCEKCSSDVVQDLSPSNNEKAKQDSPLRHKTVSLAENEESAGRYSPEKCKSIETLAVHSEKEVKSAPRGKFRMETPADEEENKRPNNLNESSGEYKDTAIEISPDVLHRETSGNTLIVYVH